MSISYNDVMTWLIDREGFLKLNDAQHRDFIHQFNEATRIKRSIAVDKFEPGDEVQFSSKTGATITGKILKLNRQTVVVRDVTTGVEWRVSGSLLRKK